MPGGQDQTLTGFQEQQEDAALVLLADLAALMARKQGESWNRG